MSAVRWIPVDVSKEIRPLLPIWLGCLIAVGAGGILDESGLFFRAGFTVFVLGSSVLGAMSVGHEYTHRTLPLLLTQPTSRRRIFAVKASVLLAMLSVLAAAALARLPVVPAGHELQDTALVGLMSLIGAAFVAPWLTMVCRNPLAGALFSLSIGASLLVGSELLAAIVYGVSQVDNPMAQRFRMDVVWAGTLLLMWVGGWASWRSFMILEAIDGSHAEMRLPAWFRRIRPGVASHENRRNVHPLWRLLRKEVRLQQLTFVVAGLYVFGWGVMLIVGRVIATTIDQPFVILTVVNAFIVALVAGSLASAEERHLGTLEWQVLQPMPASRQWMLKSAVVFGLVSALGLGLPTLLAVLNPSVEPMRVNGAFAGVVLVTAAVSLYVSSLCSAGLKALLIAVPSAFATLPILQLCEMAAYLVARLAGIRTGGVPLTMPFNDRLVAIEAVVLIVILVRLAATNHRSADSDGRRVWGQLTSAAAFMVLTAVALTAAQTLGR